MTSVRKDGLELFPVLGRSLYVDGIGNAIEASMTKAAPNSTMDVALTSVRIGRWHRPRQNGDVRATVVPVTGTHSIVVDPRGVATGVVTLSLRG